MKKAGQWKNRMVLALELPPDLAYNETIVTLTGQTEAVIENYKSVFKYTPSEQLIFFLDIPWFISCLSRKSRISPVLFLIFPSIWIFQILPVKKNIRIPPRIMPVKKAFLFLFLKKKKGIPRLCMI